MKSAISDYSLYVHTQLLGFTDMRWGIDTLSTKNWLEKMYGLFFMGIT